MMLARNRKFEDSPLERDGFELPVPRYPRWSRVSPRCAIRAEETVASEFVSTHCGRELDSNSAHGDRLDPPEPGQYLLRKQPEMSIFDSACVIKPGSISRRAGIRKPSR
jgi:hypothetical protein